MTKFQAPPQSSCFFSRLSSRSESSFSLSWHLSCNASVSFSQPVLLLASHLASCSCCFHFTCLCKGSCDLATRFRSLRKQASCLENVRRLSRNRGGVFREALREQHRLRQPFALHLWKSLDVPPLSRHRNNNSKSPVEKDALSHSLNSSKFRGMIANILCHASRHLDDKTWTSRKCSERSALHLSVRRCRALCPATGSCQHMLKLRHPPALAPLHGHAQTRPGTVLRLEFTLTTNRCRSTELANYSDPD